MITIREPYVPEFLRRAQSSAVRRSSSMPATSRLVAVGAAGESWPLDPPSESPTKIGYVLKPLTGTEKLAAAAYLAPFLLGPPVVGYMLLGTVGAVGGAILAAPAIYWVVGGLRSM